MLEYMIVYANGFNGGVSYYRTHSEAVQAGLKAKATGLIPESVYRYNPKTDKYDILLGKFTAGKKEVHNA